MYWECISSSCFVQAFLVANESLLHNKTTLEHIFFHEYVDTIKNLFQSNDAF
jgi:hypothetical protein